MKFAQEQLKDNDTLDSPQATCNLLIEIQQYIYVWKYMNLAYVTCGVKHNKIYRRITLIITLKSSYYKINVVQMRIRLSVCS